MLAAIGLSMNSGFFAAITGLRLRQVYAGIDALEHHDVDLGQQCLDRVDDLDLPFVAESAVNLSMRVALASTSGLPPLNAATTARQECDRDWPGR